MRIAIPTYKRALLIQQLTLGYLKRCGVNMAIVDLFVSGEREAVNYKNLNTGCKVITTNAANVKEKFNCIHSYYQPGTEVLVIEDDLASVKRVVGYNQLEEELNLMRESRLAFDRCAKEETALWGISSNSNPFFMKDQISVGFKFIVANMYGFIATEPPIIGTQESKTDYERTIQYYVKFGKLVRLDYLCPITKNYTNPGGMQDVKNERFKLEQDSVNYLTSTYPQLCQLNKTKDSKYPEMKLITKKGATAG